MCQMNVKMDEDFIDEVADVKLQNVELLDQIEAIKEEYKTAKEEIENLNKTMQ